MSIDYVGRYQLNSIKWQIKNCHFLLEVNGKSAPSPLMENNGIYGKK